MRLLREHAQRRREHAAAAIGEELERGVRLPRVRRPEVGDDGLRLEAPGGEDDLRLGDAHVGLAAALPLSPARPLLASATLAARHGV
jgi:hypothetical protein